MKFLYSGIFVYHNHCDVQEHRNVVLQYKNKLLLYFLYLPTLPHLLHFCCNFLKNLDS